MEAMEIEQLVRSSMQGMREVMAANTLIGAPISGSDGVTVIPVSGLSCAFLAGGGGSTRKRDSDPCYGGNGAGLRLQPICFLMLHGDVVRVLPICGSTVLDKAIDAVPLISEQLRNLKNKSDPSEQ